MCGIFGFVAPSRVTLGKKNSILILNQLFKESERRGSEAAGVAIAASGNINAFRKAASPRKMLMDPRWKAFLEDSGLFASNYEGLCLFGHTRLVTNGTQGNDDNNQPILTDHSIGVHNGIVVNDGEIWDGHAELTKATSVDSEVIYRLLDKFIAETNSVEESVRQVYKEIKGEANIAFVHDSIPALVLASNVGSLYWARLADPGFFIFASERVFLLEVFRKIPFLGNPAPSIVRRLEPGTALAVSSVDLTGEPFSLNGAGIERRDRLSGSRRPIRLVSKADMVLRRCTKCILPHTFPFIEFDSVGVCNYCREGPPVKSESAMSLESRISKFRSQDGSPDCIVALSGGRDSCYGLHVIKKELGLNPIAYTYDWAMVTDEARRNCSRICAELGVEHIIRSADILSKRRNIRLNIEAWLKKPELGMIPLFMAGDKQFFYYASQVSRQTGIPLVFFCGGNNLEVTKFKTGFCGVNDKSVNTMVGLDFIGKLGLLKYYALNYLKNPSYLNRSTFDTLFSFYSTYMNRGEFVYLYKYIDWDERRIADTLSRFYGWESAEDSASTWRIGDGTASFYNYIYHTVAGFSEHDTFRSNQIRAGLLGREDALALVREENKPRYTSMQEYANLVGFSLDEALVVINSIPKLY